MATGGDLRLEEQLGGLGPQLPQAGDLGLGERLEGNVGQGLAPPQRQQRTFAHAVHVAGGPGGQAQSTRPCRSARSRGAPASIAMA